MSGDFKFFPQQPGVQTPNHRNNSRGRIDPMRRSKNRNDNHHNPKETVEFNSPHQFRTKKSISPEIQNRD
jgi:hypothetical protein